MVLQTRYACRVECLTARLLHACRMLIYYPSKVLMDGSFPWLGQWLTRRLAYTSMYTVVTPWIVIEIRRPCIVSEMRIFQTEIRLLVPDRAHDMANQRCLVALPPRTNGRRKPLNPSAMSFGLQVAFSRSLHSRCRLVITLHTRTS